MVSALSDVKGSIWILQLMRISERLQSVKFGAIQRPMKKFICLLLISSFVSGCFAANVPTQAIEIDGATFSVEFNTVESAKSEGAGSLVFGKLAVVGQRQIESVNLECVAIEWNNHESQKLYVDSVASVLTNPFAATKDGLVVVDVYWLIPSVSFREINLTNLRLVQSSAVDRCVSYL